MWKKALEKAEQSGVIKKVDSKSSAPSNQLMGKAINQAVTQGLAMPMEKYWDEEEKKWKQRPVIKLQKGGSADRPSKEEILEKAAEEAAQAAQDFLMPKESLLGKTKKQLETQTKKKNKRLKELEAELGLQEGGMVNKYSHGGSVKGNARMQGVKKIQTQGFKFNHKIS